MVPPSSDQVSRVWPYSGFCAALSVFAYGILTLFDWPSHAILLSLRVHVAVRTPIVFLHSVWPLPRSLATTYGISVDFSSSPYLDVSVQAVPFVYLFYSVYDDRTPSAGLLHSEIHGYSAYLRLTVAYRSLSRPSSALGAKAFPLCSL